MELRDRRVLVTGASRGIGRGLAEAFADRGARVALVSRSAEPLAELADRLGGDAYPTDLRLSSSVDRLIDRVEADGPIDVLVNNAGISHVGHLLDTTPGALDEVIDVNLRAPVQLIRQVIPHMLARGGGRIVNISSMAACLSPPGLAVYGATKAGLSHFSAGLRQDLRGLPVGITLVHLGSVPTSLDDASRAYGPIRAVAQRSRGRDLVPLAQAVTAVVAAVERDERHVRLPRQQALLPAVVELPRRLTELLFRHAPARE